MLVGICKFEMVGLWCMCKCCEKKSRSTSFIGTRSATRQLSITVLSDTLKQINIDISLKALRGVADDSAVLCGFFLIHLRLL
jgi:hypothetical protein